MNDVPAAVASPVEKTPASCEEIPREKVRAQVVLHQPPNPPIAQLDFPSVPPIGSFIEIAMHGRLVSGKVEWLHFTPYNPRHTFAVGVSLPGTAFGQADVTIGIDDLQKRMDTALEWQTRAHEKLLSYTNVVMLAGYAGIFAFWGFVKDKIGTRMTLWVGLLLGLSLMIYVVYELFCMVVRTGNLQKRAKHIDDKPDDFFIAIGQIERDERRAAFRYNSIWRIAFWPTAATGLASAGLLLFAMARSLIHAVN